MCRPRSHAQYARVCENPKTPKLQAAACSSRGTSHYPNPTLGGNLLEQKNLQYIEEKIGELLNKPGYEKYCALAYTSCSQYNPYNLEQTSEGCCVAGLGAVPNSVGTGLYQATTADGCFMPSSPIQVRDHCRTNPTIPYSTCSCSPSLTSSPRQPRRTLPTHRCANAPKPDRYHHHHPSG